MTEALIFASTNPQYDDRLFIELQFQDMKIPSTNLGRTFCVQKLFLTFRTIFVNNMFSTCSAKRRVSDKVFCTGYLFLLSHCLSQNFANFGPVGRTESPQAPCLCFNFVLTLVDAKFYNEKVKMNNLSNSLSISICCLW